MSLEALRQILRRTDASAAALFGADEVAAWPAGSKETLTTLGLLREDAPARAIVCPGCDLQCLKEVEVVGEGSAARGLLFCDQRDDMEPIEIPLERLRRWSADVGGLTSSLALLLDGSRQAEEVVRGRLWWLGRGSAADGGDVFLACGTRRDDAAAIFGHPQVFRGRSVPVVLTLSDVPAGGVGRGPVRPAKRADCTPQALGGRRCRARGEGGEPPGVPFREAALFDPARPEATRASGPAGR
jgi:hypothetical protein